MSALRADQKGPQAALLLGLPVLLGRGEFSTVANCRPGRFRARREDSQHLQHLGRADLEVVAKAYAAAVRIVHDAAQTAVAHARVFVSLEHHWTTRFAAGDAQQAGPGRDLLLAFAAAVRTEGDFAWHVAFHPYPEDLFECRFWRDRSAPDRDDAARVTFANLGVLTRFLARDDLCYAGAPRRVILSEQGFHCRADAEGERDQAVALALAWHLVQRESTIDALILHRHVDHAHEGGLCLGLWTRKADSVCSPERQRLTYALFRDCDTERWASASAFALPVLGLERWADWRTAERAEAGR